MSRAQTWAPIGAKWYYNFYGSSYSIFESVGDTVINGITCRKIQKSKPYDYCFRPMQEYTYYSNDSVYFYDFNISDFQLLYDFDAVAGDFWFYRFPGYNFSGDMDSIKTIVDSTDFVIINGITLKRLFVHYEDYNFEYEWLFDDYGLDTSIIIEFIGDLRHMVNTYALDGWLSEYPLGNFVRCYDDSFIGHYETGIVDSCNYVNLLDITDFENESFSVYPNPTNDKIFLDGDSSFYKIYSSDGKLIQSGEVGSEHAIDVSNLQNGIYFLTLDDSKQAIRFVKVTF